MSLFSKTKKYRKPSRDIDEKVKVLNKELEKTGVVLEDAPANSTGGLYCVKGDQPEENEDIAALRDAAAEAEGVTDFTYGGSTAPDGTTRNNLFQGYGMWGPEDTPTMWWKNANGYWNWMAWIPYNFYTQNPDGTRIDGGGWGVHSSTWIGAVGVPGVGGVGGSSVPSEIEAKIKNENGDYMPPDTFEAPPPPRPVLFQGGLGDPGYFPGDIKRSEEEEEARNEAKNQLDVGDYGLDWIENQSSDDVASLSHNDIRSQILRGQVPFMSTGEANYQLTHPPEDGWDWDTLQILNRMQASADDSGTYGTYASVSGNEEPVEVTVDVPPPDDKDGEVTDKDVKKWADKVRDSVGNYLNKVKDFYSDFDTAKDNLSTLANTLQSVPTSGNTLQNYLNNNDPNHSDYRKNDPRSNNYQGPYEAKTDAKWKNKVGSQIKKSIPSWSDMEERAKNSSDGKTELTNKEITAISHSMHPSSNGSMEFHTLLNSLPVSGDPNSDDIPGKDAVTTVTLDKDGNIDIVTNYRFTDRDDVSAGGPPMKMYVNHFMKKDKGDSGVPSKDAGTYGYYEKDKSVAPYGSDENPLVGTTHDINVRLKLNINGGNSSNWGKKGNENKKFEGMMKNIYNSYEPEGEVLSEGWESPKHTDVDKDEKKRWFNQKDIHPDYPRKAPPKMVGGWHPDLKKNDETPIPTKQYIKIKEVDLIKNYRMKGKEIKKFMNTINSINSYLTRNPSALIHAQMRYPKSDPHLAALNYKMDMQLAAADEYIDKQFPENQRLYNRLMQATKRSIKLTDPKTFKDKKGKMTSYKKLLRIDYVLNEYDPEDKEVKNRKIKSNKKSAGRFFRKPKKKTKDDILKDKMAILDNEMKKTMPDY